MTTTRTQAEKLAQKIAYVQSHSVPCYEHNGQLVIVSRFSVWDANGNVQNGAELVTLPAYTDYETIRTILGY